ncbi:MAG: putative glutathione S-transferase [Cellvibrionaceae bacterium]|jgi:putative glutathione S-transferase
MGQLVNGKWEINPVFVKDADGRFRRKDAAFRDWIKADGSTPYTPEAGRYHLYIANACPWAHRTMIFRKLRQLEDVISISIVDTLMFDNGWRFRDGEGYIPDTVNEKDFMHEVYTAADPTFTGRVTVPVLWDKKTGTIVNNESSEIIRMLNSEFSTIAAPGTDYYPEHLRADIDEINERIYHTVNNGVYKSGFARSQDAYEEAVTELFDTLDMLEDRLDKQRYLVGEQITEADWRLFTTLVRFDPVYVGHFKCNLKRIVDYPNLSNYLRELYQVPGVTDTVDLAQIKEHYYSSHESVNPSRVVPVGPEINYDQPHNRDRF